MANAFKNAGAALTTGGADIYQAGAGVSAVIHSIYIANIDGTNDATVDVKVTTDGGSTYFHVAKTIPVPADSSLVLDKPINLEPTDKIHATASANGDLEIYMAILEIT